MFGFNSALKNKKFTINSFSRVSYRNQVAFLYNKETLHDDKNTTTGLTLAENLNGPIGMTGLNFIEWFY